MRGILLKGFCLVGLGIGMSAPSWAVSAFYEQFARAQQAFEEGQAQKAQHEFEWLVKSAYSEQLSPVQRQSFFHSYLRLAQLSKDGFQKKLWLLKAMETMPRVDPDPELFPPPLLALYRELKAQRQGLETDTADQESLRTRSATGARKLALKNTAPKAIKAGGKGPWVAVGAVLLGGVALGVAQHYARASSNAPTAPMPRTTRF